jgi:hypothetical protein
MIDSNTFNQHRFADGYRQRDTKVTDEMKRRAEVRRQIEDKRQQLELERMFKL